MIYECHREVNRPDVVELAKLFYSSLKYNYSPNGKQDIIIIGKNGGSSVVSATRLCEENGVAVLRGVQVRPGWQGVGIGTEMVTLVIHLAQCNGNDRLWCIPYAHLESYYNKFGFQGVVEGLAPMFLQDRIAGYRSQNPDQKFIIMARTL